MIETCPDHERAEFNAERFRWECVDCGRFVDASRVDQRTGMVQDDDPNAVTA